MIDSSEIKINISSPPDREFLVAEIFVGNEQIAEINQESKKLEVEIYPRKSGDFWRINYEDLIKILQEAKRKLEEH